MARDGSSDWLEGCLQNNIFYSFTAMMKLWRYLKRFLWLLADWWKKKKSTINHQISQKSSPSLCSRLACHITLKYDSPLTHSALCLPLKIHEAALLLQTYTGLIEHLLRFDLQPKFKHLHPWAASLSHLKSLNSSFYFHHISWEIIQCSISFYSSGSTCYIFRFPCM